MGLKEVKRSKSFTSTLITAFIIFMLVLSGPAGAVSITIPTMPSSISQGQDLTLTFRVDLDTGERIPISSYNITVYNSTWQQTFLVYPGGIGGPNVTVSSAGSSYNVFDYGYGYRWGYGYGYDLSYYNYTFGYGYGYGYAAPGYETYNVTLNLSAFNLAAGTYYVNITIDTGDPSKIYSSTAYSFTIAGVSAYEVTTTANTTTIKANITSMEQGQTVSSGVVQTPHGTFELAATANASAPPMEITVNVSTEVPSGVSDLATYAGAIPGLYFTIDVNDTSWFNNISQVQVKFYYSEADIPSGVSESTLRPLRYTAGSWIRLVAPPQTTLDDGTILYASGVDTASNYVWANLSRFSTYGIGGSTIKAVKAVVEGARGAVIKRDIQTIITTTKTVLKMVEQFFLETRQFFVSPPELAGILGSLGHMPTTQEHVTELSKKLAKPVQTLVGDTYEIASDKVLKKFKKAKKVVIARGDLGVDSLAAVAYAKNINAPILLVKPKELPAVTEKALTSLKTESTVIIGGPVAVSVDVEKKLPKATRIWGKDRYETAVKVAEALIQDSAVTAIVVTDGLNPDVHAVLVASYYKAPIVYVAGDKVPEVTKNFIKKYKVDGTKRIILISVSEAAEKAIKDIGS